MPLYEYRCSTCGQVYEKLVRMGAADVPPCPACGASEGKRLVSAIASLAGRGDCGPSGST
ncbi:MAG TPA: zinc ribbon domain-containing protein [Chloroflexota bacterium]|nr:zinc ribbon domain-containing protein [Chloroflexota bacterium]